MKTPRVLSTIIAITVVAVLYVHQQTEIFRLAYDGQAKSRIHQELLDKNTILRYNIRKAESLIYIGAKVCENEELQMPDAYQVVSVNYPRQRQVRNTSSPLALQLVSRIFGIKRQAEARTISPSVTSE